MQIGEIENMPYKESKYPFMDMKPDDSVKIEFDEDEKPILFGAIRAAAYRAGLKINGVFKCRHYRDLNYVRVWRVK